MTKQNLPPIPEIRKLIDYDPETGAMLWKVRPRSMFTSDRIWRAWNSRCAGKKALANNNNGYLAGRILGVQMSAHRIAYALVHNEWPNVVDHLNGVRSDNRAKNLVSVTVGENGLNRARQARNSTGVCGVYLSTNKKRWVASITKGGVTKYLGTFDDIERARAARSAAEVQLGFNANHGRRAAQ